MRKETPWVDLRDSTKPQRSHPSPTHKMLNNEIVEIIDTCISHHIYICIFHFHINFTNHLFATFIKVKC